MAATATAGTVPQVTPSKERAPRPHPLRDWRAARREGRWRLPLGTLVNRQQLRDLDEAAAERERLAESARREEERVAGLQIKQQERQAFMDRLIPAPVFVNSFDQRTADETPTDTAAVEPTQLALSRAQAAREALFDMMRGSLTDIVDSEERAALERRIQRQTTVVASADGNTIMIYQGNLSINDQTGRIDPNAGGQGRVTRVDFSEASPLDLLIARNDGLQYSEARILGQGEDGTAIEAQGRFIEADANKLFELALGRAVQVSISQEGILGHEAIIVDAGLNGQPDPAGEVSRLTRILTLFSGFIEDGARAQEAPVIMGQGADYFRPDRILLTGEALK